MRFSIRSQIIFLVITLMTITMTAIIVITTGNFEDELRQLHTKLAQDALKSALQTIDAEYQELEDYEVDTIMRRRELMANVSLSVLANIQVYQDLARAGILTERDAQQRSLAWIRDFRYGNDQYFFVYDETLRGLAHPSDDMIGQVWEGFQDLRHRDALRLMLEITQKVEGQAYTVFQWPIPDSRERVKQLGYFRYYREWAWIVGTTIRIDDLERESHGRLQKIIQRLEQIFLTKRFAESGHIFIFTGEGQLLIHPERSGDTLGNLLLSQLKNASKTPDIPFEHPTLNSADATQLALTYTAYFSQLNWYVAASIPQSAIQQPINRLAIRETYVIMGIFAAGLLTAIFLSRKIALPLEALTQYAHGLSSKNFSEDHTQTLATLQSNSTELDALIQSFFFMESQLRNHLHELHKYQNHLEDLVDQRTRELSRAVDEARDLNTQLRNEITERTNAEKQIRNLNRGLEQRVQRRTAKLEAANKELQSFAYVVSHDLKAPLRGISRLAYWLGTDYAEAIDEDGKEMLDLLIGRVTRMDNLIEGILQYSRIGRLRKEILRVDLHKLVSEVIAMLAPPEHIHISIESPLPCLVVEKVRIFQVFQNLLSNGITYIDKPEGHIQISCVENDAHWIFCVRDNGPGIAPKYHEKIFQIFQTLTPRDERESTGIGLSLVQKIIELHQGRIWLESCEGQGSAFYFTLPKELSLGTEIQ